jgi:2-phosphosulfolactate phosphatase
LHVAVGANANSIITGSFCNISSVCDYLVKEKSNVILACAAWKNRINIEDTLFAGAVINRIKENFDINCDASQLAETLYLQSNGNLFDFMKEKNASHYYRLMNFGLEDDIRFCLTEDNANILSKYSGGRLVAG